MTKGHSADAVRSAVAAGLSDCGENRVAELDEKVGEVGRDAATWHLIGHLQRNKVRRALPALRPDPLVDSRAAGRRVVGRGRASAIDVRGLVQVNVSGEETKGGFNASRRRSRRWKRSQRVSTLPGLTVQGLMTMAPLTEDEGTLRGTFARARELFDRAGNSAASMRGICRWVCPTISKSRLRKAARWFAWEPSCSGNARDDRPDSARSSQEEGRLPPSMRGYDPALVDDFLDLVADRLEELVRAEPDASKSGCPCWRTQVADFRERENALTEALVTAQEMREEMRRQVEKEASSSRREAEQQAEQIRVERCRARARRGSLRRLRARRMQLLQASARSSSASWPNSR